MKEKKRNCPICNNNANFLKNIEGYKNELFYDIYECEICDTSFSHPIIKNNEIYNLIYKNANKIPGYMRYNNYKNKIKLKENPLQWLINQEEDYWAIGEFIKKGEITKKDRILEVGCGLGYLTYALNKEGYNIFGIDISEKAIAVATENFDSNNENIFKHKDIFNLIENEFDVVISTEVIEHVTNPLIFLLQLKKIGKKVIINTPNKTFFSNKNNSVWLNDLPPVHFFWFSEQSFKYICEMYKWNYEFINFSNCKTNNYLESEFKQENFYPFFNKDGTLKFLFEVKSVLRKIPVLKNMVQYFKQINKNKKVHSRERSYIQSILIKN